MRQADRVRVIEKLYRESDLVGPSGLFPFGKSTLWAWVKAGKFPRPYKLGPRITVWTHSDVLSFWAEAQTGVDNSVPTELHGAGGEKELNRLTDEKAK